MKYLNREKIEFAKRVSNGESVEAVANEAAVSRGIIYQWVSYHNAGMFKGREHLKTIGFAHTKKKPLITPKRVNEIVSDYVHNQPRAVARAEVEAPAIPASVISELTRRVAMLEKVVLR